LLSVLETTEPSLLGSFHMNVKVSLGTFLLAPVAILLVTAGCSKDPEVAKR